MNPTQIENALIQNRQKALAHGVEPENASLVSLTMTIIDNIASIQPPTPMAPYKTVGMTLFSETEPLPPTFGEWAANYNLENHRDRFVVCAGYLLESNQPIVNTGNVIELYRKARWDKPQNPADVFTKAAKSGLFTDEDIETPEGELKRWRLTNTGYKHYQNLRKDNGNE